MRKKCITCKENLPLTSFTKNKSREDGLQIACKNCQRKNVAKNNPKRHDVKHHKYPAPKDAVYAIINDNKTIVYVGESSRTSLRLAEHLENHTGRTSVGLYVEEKWDYIILWDGTNKTTQERKALEAMFIFALRPELNKQWKK